MSLRLLRAYAQDWRRVCAILITSSAVMELTVAASQHTGALYGCRGRLELGDVIFRGGGGVGAEAGRRADKCQWRSRQNKKAWS